LFSSYLSGRGHRVVATFAPRRRASFLIAALSLAALATEACKGSSSPTPPVTGTVPVATVDVSPTPVSLVVGATSQLTATTKSAAGATLTGRTVSWSSSDQTIASVSTSGLVTGVKAGSATVTATSEGISKGVPVTISALPVATVDISPSPASVSVSATIQLTATPKSSTGAALTDRQVAWSVADQTVATITTGGLLTGVKAGSTTATATIEGISKDVSVTVSAIAVASVDVAPSPASVNVGASVSLTATPRSSTGVALTDRQVKWSIADATIATISASGSLTGVKPGTTTATATSEGIHKDVAVTVNANAVSVLTFATQPSNATAGVAITPAIQVQLKDSFGNIVPSSATVTLTVTGGAGDGGGATGLSVSAVNGVATFSNVVLTHKGTAYQLVASANGVQTTSSAFNIAAAAAAAIAKVAGDAQTAVAGTVLPTSPSVRVTDAFGNGVNGVTVTFAPASGSGSVTAGTPTTDANGAASVGSWTVGPTMGPNTLNVTSGSAATTFNATVTGAVAPGVEFVVGALGSASSASVATGSDIAVPLTIDLTNRGTVDVASIQVTLSWDPSRLHFKSESAGNWQDSQGSGASVTSNTNDASCSGVIRIAGFTTSETLTSFVLRNLVFTATGAAGSTVNITATITAAGNAAGSPITVVTRPLAVTVTP
jgi:uncharacterized protein YjdB